MTLRFTKYLLGASLALAPASVAFGQVGLTSTSDLGHIGTESQYTSVNLNARGNETGVKLSEDTVLHLGITGEAGYDSNVFYTKYEPTSSPILLITPSIELTNQNRDGSIPSGVFFNLGASLQYREYLSEDPNTRAQRAFNPAVAGNVEFSSGQRLSLALGEQFIRTEEPPYGAGGREITRDYNLASAQLRVVPGGGRIQGLLRYSNAIDYFENEEYKFANSMGHELMLDTSWRWLPKTALYLQAAQGMITYLTKDPTNPKYNSYPLRLLAGVRGLVTEKVSVDLAAGYAAAFYQGGAENPSGLSNLVANAEFTYHLSVLTRMMVGYRREFRNSVIGVYYDVDAATVGLRQMVERLQIGAIGRYENRRYQGLQYQGTPLDRRDHAVMVGASADYFLQEWFYAGVGYNLAFNDSNIDMTLTDVEGLDYVKHRVLGRIGIVY